MQQLRLENLPAIINIAVFMMALIVVLQPISTTRISSLLFGLNSELLKKIVQRPMLNMGVNAGLPLHSELNQRQPWMDESIKGSKLKHYGKEFVPDARGLRLITAIARELESRDICVLFLPPPLLIQGEYRNDPDEKAFYEQFPKVLKSHHLTLLAKPYDFMYPQSYFFDTPFHLVDEQRQIHTQRMGKLLKDAWRINVKDCEPRDEWN